MAASYIPVEDSAVISARFESGASATLQVSAVCWEGTPFGQIHELDLHGSGGTLHALNDWDTVQEVRGVRAGEPGPAKPLVIPDSAWSGAPRDRVHDTYRHIFRRTEAMTRQWVTAVAAGQHVEPDFATGARVQELVEAAVTSAATDGSWQAVRGELRRYRSLRALLARHAASARSSRSVATPRRRIAAPATKHVHQRQRADVAVERSGARGRDDERALRARGDRRQHAVGDRHRPHAGLRSGSRRIDEPTVVTAQVERDEHVGLLHQRHGATDRDVVAIDHASRWRATHRDRRRTAVATPFDASPDSTKTRRRRIGEMSTTSASAT